MGGCRNGGGLPLVRRSYPPPLSVPHFVGLEGQPHPGIWSGRWTYAQLLIPFYVSLVLTLTCTVLSFGMLEGITGFRYGVGKARGLT